jgi:hypothetical protein
MKEIVPEYCHEQIPRPAPYEAPSFLRKPSAKSAERWVPVRFNPSLTLLPIVTSLPPHSAFQLIEPSLTPLRAEQYTSFFKSSGIGHDAAIAGLRIIYGE